MTKPLVDPEGRTFPYLRLSVTDVCNFSCQYCLPNGYQCQSKQDFLTIREIKHLVDAFAHVGTWKVRLTGGEPSTRKDLTEIIACIASNKKIKQLAITTNGYQLKQNIDGWVDAGINHLNVSVDSLDPRLFHSLTGHNRLQSILDGIDRALALSLDTIKLNAVLLNGINHDQLSSFLDFVKYRSISFRFIELMQTQDNLNYFNRHHVSANTIVQQLLNLGWQKQPNKLGAGPAIEFKHPDYLGSIGIIAPYAKDFCQSCNRLRVSATGRFHLCLFGEGGYSIRQWLQDENDQPQLIEKLKAQLRFKKSSHFLDQGNPGATPHLASVGG